MEFLAESENGRNRQLSFFDIKNEFRSVSIICVCVSVYIDVCTHVCVCVSGVVISSIAGCYVEYTIVIRCAALSLLMLSGSTKEMDCRRGSLVESVSFSTGCLYVYIIPLPSSRYYLSYDHYGLPYVIGQTIIFLLCDFYLLSFYLFFFIPRLISAAAGWMSTILPHMLWP